MRYDQAIREVPPSEPGTLEVAEPSSLVFLRIHVVTTTIYRTPP